MDLENKISKENKEEIKKEIIIPSLIGFGITATYLICQAYIKFFQGFGEVVKDYLESYIKF